MMGGKMARVLITLLLAFMLSYTLECFESITISFIQDGEKIGHIGQLKLAKGGLISELFSFWLKFLKSAKIQP